MEFLWYIFLYKNIPHIVVSLVFERDKKKNTNEKKHSLKQIFLIDFFFFFFTLSSTYKVGTSVFAGWHKQNILCDEPERYEPYVYIFIPQLFTQTLKSVKSRPQPADQHTYWETTG